MKKNFIHPLFFILSIGILLFACCKEDKCDDPTNRFCPNFDICLVTPEADASFALLDSINPSWADTSIGFLIDTITQWGTVYFKALNKNMESYEWKVGTDPGVFTHAEFSLLFGRQFEGRVDVRLITTARDNGACLDEEQLRDTLYQGFQVVDIWPYDVPIIGEYRGSDLSKPNEEYTITVLGEGEDLWHSTRLLGLQVPCDYPIGLRFQGGYDWFISDHDDVPCRNTIVIGRLQEDRKTLKVEYFYDADDGTRVHEFFEGTRI